MWAVNQEHYAEEMNEGDEVFLWRAGGKAKATAGVIGRCVLTGRPEMREDDAAAKGYWTSGDPTEVTLRVPMKVIDRKMGAKEVVKASWLSKRSDPLRAQNPDTANWHHFPLRPNEAERLSHW